MFLIATTAVEKTGINISNCIKRFSIFRETFPMEERSTIKRIKLISQNRLVMKKTGTIRIMPKHIVETIYVRN